MYSLFLFFLFFDLKGTAAKRVSEVAELECVVNIPLGPCLRTLSPFIFMQNLGITLSWLLVRAHHHHCNVFHPILLMKKVSSRKCWKRRKLLKRVNRIRKIKNLNLLGIRKLRKRNKYMQETKIFNIFKF